MWIDLLLAITFGGMVTFQALFAPLIFIKLDMPTARKFIRAFFPFYYLYFGAASALLSVCAYMYFEYRIAGLSFLGLVGFCISAFYLMPQANKATDNEDKARFNKMHRLTVLINTFQLVLFGVLIAFYR